MTTPGAWRQLVRGFHPDKIDIAESRTSLLKSVLICGLTLSLVFGITGNAISSHSHFFRLKKTIIPIATASIKQIAKG